MAYTTRDVSEGDSTIYGRDVERRMDELGSDRQHIIDQLDEQESEAEDYTGGGIDDLHVLAYHVNAIKDELKAWDESDDGEEYRKLKAFWDQISGYGGRDLDLICDDYFETYARETAEEIHGTTMGEWPFGSIEWAQACRDLQQDYSIVEFGTTTYWYRS